MRRIAQGLAAGVACLVLLAGAAAAQTFPTKPITLIVPFAAGGPSDVIARLVGQSMSRTLGQSVIIENVSGAGGTSGAARTARAAPDGYTLLIHHLALAAAPSLYSNLPYDTARGFEPLGLLNTGPMVVTSKLALEASDAAALFRMLKERGTGVTMAHAGVGSNSHLCSLLLAQVLGAKPTLVAYRGTGPAMNDLVAGQVDTLCDQATSAVPQIQGGKVKAFAVTAADRLDVIPTVPTAREAGLAGFEMTVWHGLYAPAGTPAPVLEQLHGAIVTAIEDRDVQERFKATGTLIFPTTERSREAHAKRFQGEIARWAQALSAAGIQPGASQ